MKKDLFNKLKLYIEENVELIQCDSTGFITNKPSVMLIENSKFENVINVFIKLKESEYNTTINPHLNSVSTFTMKRFNDIIEIEMEVFDYVLEWLEEETVFNPTNFQIGSLDLFAMHLANYFEDMIGKVTIMGDWRYDTANELHFGLHTTDYFKTYVALRKIFDTTSLKVVDGTHFNLHGLDITIPTEEVHLLFDNVSVKDKKPFSKLKEYASTFVEKHFDIKGRTNN